MMKGKKILRTIVLFILVVLLTGQVASSQPAVTVTRDGITLGSSDDPRDVAASIQLLLILTVLSLAPSILIMMTSFTRIIIILSFLRNALGTNQVPPNQVLIGLALFLTLFIMTPVIGEINRESYQPYIQGEVDQKTALDRSSNIIKGFMLRQFRDSSEKDLAFFIKLAGIETPVRPEELPLSVVIPAFIVNEITIAFKFGFIIFIPFLIIDMVVSSTLMSMGMFMLPPVLISLPFKILLFMMVNGWELVVESIVKSFSF